MTLLASAPGWLASILFFLLLAASIEDLWRLQIEDWFSVGVALLAGVALAVDGPERGLWENLLLFALVLGVGAFLFALGWMGGGDVKLLAGCALWFGLGSGWKMLVAVSIAGGLESLIIMLMRRLPWPESFFRRIAWLRKGEPLPYGVAIAAGMIWSGLIIR